MLVYHLFGCTAGVVGVVVSAVTADAGWVGWSEGLPSSTLAEVTHCDGSLIRLQMLPPCCLHSQTPVLLSQ